MAYIVSSQTLEVYIFLFLKTFPPNLISQPPSCPIATTLDARSGQVSGYYRFFYVNIYTRTGSYSWDHPESKYLVHRTTRTQWCLLDYKEVLWADYEHKPNHYN